MTETDAERLERLKVRSMVELVTMAEEAEKWKERAMKYRKALEEPQAPIHVGDQNVLAISAHGDDALVCAGGTLKRLADEGNEVTHLTLSLSAVSQLPDYSPDDYWRELDAACAVLGVEHEVVDYPTRRFPECRDELREELFTACSGFDLIFTHSPTDTHQDHRVVGEEVSRVAPKYATILGYDMPWSARSVPTAYFTINHPEIWAKIDALAKLKSQIAKNPEYLSIDAVESLALVRGLACGSPFAEAFDMLRYVR